MRKRFTTKRPNSDTKPVSVWIQLFDEDGSLIQQKLYHNVSMINARQRAFGHCDLANNLYKPKAHTALVLRGGCDPENPDASDIWEDYTREQGLKGYLPIPTLEIKLSKPV